MTSRKSRSDPRGGWLVRLGFAAVLLWVATPQAQSGTGGINRTEHLDKAYVVLVSLDGFRADYLERFDLPNLKRIVKRGARARSLIPVFPSLTFPNHYSLVTGLFPDRHGIVSNSFYDPERRAKYSMTDTATVRDGTWYGGEPIWVTAEAQGMVAACFFWPGSEAAITGVRPTLVKTYDAGISNSNRVKGVLEWLKLPAERRPHLVTVYFSAVDDASHRGPLDDLRVTEAARALDRTVGQLLDGLDALPIKDRIYLLITSDHGMVDTSGPQSIAIESVVDLDGVLQTFVGAVTSLHVQDQDATRAARLRDEVNARLKHGRAYLRRELPERFHYSAHPRSGDVIIVMDEGWTLRRSYDVRRIVRPRWGAHGWDPDLPSMRGIFLALGPGIRSGLALEDVRNVDVYPLMTEVLGLKMPAGVDGSPGHLRQQLERPTPAPLGSDLDFRNRGGVRSRFSQRSECENRDLTPDRCARGGR